MEHLVDGHGIDRKGKVSVKGTHDIDKFYEVIDNEAATLGLSRSDYIISVKEHSTIKGIYEIEYQIPTLEMDRKAGGILKPTYNPDGTLKTKLPRDPKTTFDSNMLDNVVKWGNEAVKQFEESGEVMTEGVNSGYAKNKLKFEWRVVDGKIESIYPVFD